MLITRFTPVTTVIQMRGSWHEGGMFMGMHWGWWSVWVLTLFILVWAFWRMAVDRSETRRQTQRKEAAEGELRAMFARGEIGEDEFAERLTVLQQTNLSV